MRNTHRSRNLQALLLAGCVLLPAISTPADTVYTQTTPTGKPFPRPNVTVNKIAKEAGDDFESLYYTTNDSSRTEHRELSKVVQIEAEGETAFNQAEVEFMKGDLKAAGEDYRRAMSSSSKDWLKHRADLRLLGISSKTGDFLGAVAGYVEMVKKDPVAAQTQKPAVASAKPDQLSAAITTVNRGLAGATVETKMVLYPYLIELQNKNGDSAGASQTLAALKALHPAAAQNPAANPGVGSVPDSPDANALLAKQAEADTALTKAGTLLASRDYEKTIATINGASASFVDPDRQAKALFLIAEAKAATATTSEALQDAALAYMRVVAHFKAQPQAAEALYKTGTIEEKLGKLSEARLIYNQVINEYADSSAAAEAKAAVARLK